MAEDHSTRAPDARSSNGTGLYRTACPDCGGVRLLDKRKVGSRCLPCANRNRSTHGLVGHPLYRKLNNIKARCTYPSASSFSYYGGRGIKVCDAWSADPAAFIAWAEANGYQPGLEIDRIDPDGDYSPENCRWLAHKENSQRRRNARCNAGTAAAVKAFLAEGTSVKQAAKTAGVPYMAAWHISKGNTWG